MTEMNQPPIKGEIVELRLAESNDLEHLARWLNDPSVYRWWGGEPVSRDEIQQKYTGRRSPQVVSYIVEESGIPVGYAQSWQLTESYCGLDIFLDSTKQGRGLGTDAVCVLTKYLIAIEGRLVITADPASDNVRALAMWRKAGFIPSGRITDDGNPEFIFSTP